MWSNISNSTRYYIYHILHHITNSYQIKKYLFLYWCLRHVRTYIVNALENIAHILIYSRQTKPQIIHFFSFLFSLSFRFSSIYSSTIFNNLFSTNTLMLCLPYLFNIWFSEWWYFLVHIILKLRWQKARHVKWRGDDDTIIIVYIHLTGWKKLKYNTSSGCDLKTWGIY